MHDPHGAAPETATIRHRADRAPPALTLRSRSRAERTITAKFTEFTGFTDAERDYLRRQPLGRLATVDASGQPRANPVGYFLQNDGTLLIGGAAMGRTKKWRNLQANPKTALVVDDLAGTVPWRPLGIEIRGTAELTTGPTSSARTSAPK